MWVARYEALSAVLARGHDALTAHPDRGSSSRTLGCVVGGGRVDIPEHRAGGEMDAAW